MTQKDPLATTGLPALNRRDNDDNLSRRNVDTHDQQTSFLILAVDDLADNLAMISLDLQTQGYRVVTASNGEDAVAVATQTIPSLILMDISMPGLDGLTAVDQAFVEVTLFKSSKKLGYVLFTHCASLIVTPALRVPAMAKLMAMRWSS